MVRKQAASDFAAGRRPYQGRCFVDKQALDRRGFGSMPPVARSKPPARAPPSSIHD